MRSRAILTGVGVLATLAAIGAALATGAGERAGTSAVTSASPGAAPPVVESAPVQAAASSTPPVESTPDDARPDEVLDWPDANATFAPLDSANGLVSDLVAEAAIDSGLRNTQAAPEANGPSTVALYSYRNSAYGRTNHDGSVTSTYTNTPVWLFQVPLSGPIAGLSQGGPGSISPTSGSGCSYYFVVDARDGSFLTSGEHCDVMHPGGSTVPSAGK